MSADPERLEELAREMTTWFVGGRERHALEAAAALRRLAKLERVLEAAKENSGLSVYRVLVGRGPRDTAWWAGLRALDVGGTKRTVEASTPLHAILALADALEAGDG